MNPIDEILNALLTAPVREVKIVYVASFRLPTFKPGEEHGRDFIVIARRGTRAEAQAAMDAHVAENAKGMVYMREGRKLHAYTQAGVYMGHYTVNGMEEI